MKRPDEYARNLLAKARDDAYLVRQSLADMSVADWIVGFHAQQTVEKSLKAILSLEEIEYPRTYSIKRLLQLLEANGIELPVDYHSMPELTGFAADLRYGARPDAQPAERIDRGWALACVERTLAWAARMIEPNP